MLKVCVFQKFVVLLRHLLYFCVAKRKTNTIMVTTQPTSERNFGKMHEPMLSVSTGRALHSIDEFADRLGKKLGQHYGVNDIRELLQ